MGHNVEATDSRSMGGYQAIMVTPAGAQGGRYYRAGSDHRKDGQAVGW